MGKNILDYGQSTAGLALATFIIFVLLLMWWVPYSNTPVNSSTYDPYKGATLVQLPQGITQPLDTDAVYVSDCRANDPDGYARGFNLRYNSTIDINGNWKNNEHYLSDLQLQCNDRYVPQVVAETTPPLQYPELLDPIDQMYYLNIDPLSGNVVVNQTPNPVVTTDMAQATIPDQISNNYNILNHVNIVADPQTGIVLDLRNNNDLTSVLPPDPAHSGDPNYKASLPLWQRYVPAWRNPSINPLKPPANTTGDMTCPYGTRITGLRTKVRKRDGQVLQQLQNRAVTDVELICSPF